METNITMDKTQLGNASYGGIDCLFKKREKVFHSFDSNGWDIARCSFLGGKHTKKLLTAFPLTQP